MLKNSQCKISNKMVIEFLYANIRIQETTDLKPKQKFNVSYNLSGIELYLNEMK